MQVVKVINAKTNEELGVYPDSYAYLQQQSGYTYIFDCASGGTRSSRQTNYIDGNWVARFTGDIITIEVIQ